MDDPRTFSIEEPQLAEIAGRLSRIAQNGLPLASISEIAAIMDVLGDLRSQPMPQLSLQLEAAE